ncbi:hypothetical protein B0H12DRAFT_1229247 [Mycena haematopus]|nr:hypothetical protein B0H12DRAFT_1229247 [Mycena haematopus]
MLPAGPNTPIDMENALQFLSLYDTVILMDDSSSMVLPGSSQGKSRWDEACDALATLAEILNKYDTDGIDVNFLNNRKANAVRQNTSEAVRGLFSNMIPRGSTYIGDQLDKLLKQYVTKLEQAHIEPDGTPTDKKTHQEIKRMSVIVITDGEATDDPKDSIIGAATRLKAMPNLSPVQLGIQFVQIGNDARATEALRKLDDDIHKIGNIPDIVDTTSYAKLNPVTADGIIKAVMGGINRRIDMQT